MLSAHEFATLMLVKDSADQIADREELDTLLERQLVALEQLAGGTLRPRITQDGDSLLRALKRIYRHDRTTDEAGLRGPKESGDSGESYIKSQEMQSVHPVQRADHETAANLCLTETGDYRWGCLAIRKAFG